MRHIAATSIEYVEATVTADITLGAQTVHMAIITGDDDPQAGDWKTAAWAGSGTTANARILVGPGQAITLAQDTAYTVWVKITTSPETPVLRCYTLRTH